MQGLRGLFKRQDEWTLHEVVNRIIEINEDNETFWSNAHGWAPIAAADLLSISRLDWQTSLSYTLKKWINEGAREGASADGSLILAWANLGALVEGTMKLLLCVYYVTYKDDPDAILINDYNKGVRVIAEPDAVKFDRMRVFFKKRVWTAEQAHWDNWVLEIQQKRNVIHAFKHRELGSFDDFYSHLRKYLEFLQIINSRLPRP
ncbi:hypothetical protein J15TS10_29020 [Paenibacillus woosongensis]|uniref:Uncharacterized protein n=2 Tax=Paenibacillus woosongensis TaxID=307580 RepID=A0ABQ4MT52_9BACL|nr:hypothetical protein J15TS10_29020 [Paenibacillus woosongensis]